MKPRSLLLLIILFCGLSISFSGSATAQSNVVVLVDPLLDPPYGPCSETYWYKFLNDIGHNTYLTLNADAQTTGNSAVWRPTIPLAGYYRVEAYIALHGPISWDCGMPPRTIEHDTTDARYTIHHVYGSTTRSFSQYPLSSPWLDLGEYYFRVGSDGYVSLTDENGEEKFTTTVSFSAIRFTYTRPTRPSVYIPDASSTRLANPPPPDRGAFQAQGFDACHLPDISDMQTWWNSSPYRFYGLYLGGVHLPSFCERASASWVSQVHQQGWSFVPTWVGPQAPCTTYLYRISADPAVAYHEGRQEAKSASIAATKLGLTNNGWGGTVIYYDLEAFGRSNEACRQATKAFMNGWVERLHELGNIAGGYGSYNSNVTDWVSIPNIPNDVWAAYWYTNQYDPAASVNNIPWLQDLWTYHQRIFQYAGGHNESWGGKTQNIDSDVADGMIAMPLGSAMSAPIVTVSPTTQDAGWLTADQGWLVMENRLYWTVNRGSSWQVLPPTDVQMAAFLPTGDAWVISGREGGKIMLYHSKDGGLRWVETHFEPPAEGWRPIQIQLTSPDSGWIVLQKQASQAFDVGILLKTSDGGQTWQKVDLPFAAQIHFTSATQGWIQDHTGQKVYQTSDGGLTWQRADPTQVLQTQPSLPEGTILSGWEQGGAGWAITSTGVCSGEKDAPGFACTLDYALMQSLDEGHSWQNIPLPGLNSSMP